MKTIYFPFVGIREATLAAVNALFGKAVVYRPSKTSRTALLTRWAAEGRLEIVEPISGDEPQFEQLIREYRNWGNLHEGDRGLKAALTRIRKGGFPFFDQNAVSRIRSQIIGDPASRAPDQEPPPLLQDRLFLHLTWIYDSMNSEILAEMEELSSLEKRLHEAMGTETQPRAGFSLPAEDPGAFMTAERVRSWTRLFLHGADAENGDASALFVTDSRAVLEHLLDHVSQTHVLCLRRQHRPGAETTPSSEQPLFSTTERIEQSIREKASMQDAAVALGQKEGDVDRPAGALTVSFCIVEGVSPRRLFEAASNGKQTEKTGRQREPDGTLLALLE